MARQFSVAVRNAQVAAYEATIGASPTLELRTGAPPVNCAAPDSGTLIASMVLPADWMTAPSGGSISDLGTWTDLSADASGTVGHFRLKQGATCHDQGTVTITGGGGDMILNAVALMITQEVTITPFIVTAGGA